MSSTASLTDAMSLTPSEARLPGAGQETRRLDAGWEIAATPPDAHAGPAGLEGLSWQPADVPGTAAGALSEPAPGTWEGREIDAEDWWFHTRFQAPPAGPGEEVLLGLDGIATVAEVYLNGERVLKSESMFIAHTLDVGERLRGQNELAICCRALAPLLRPRRKPRARWRTALVDGNLRFFRTMLLGRAPGFAPEPPAIGPYRPVRLERRRQLSLDDIALRPRLMGADGVLSVRARLRGLDGPPPTSVDVELAGPSGNHHAPLESESAKGDTVVVQGELTVPAVAPWWPHTHGEPNLHEVRMVAATESGPLDFEVGRIGFRTIAPGPTADHDAELEGLDLHVNGLRVFARGAVWTPLDVVGLAPSEAELRMALECVRDAGMNMLRVPGVGAYETKAFYRLCDELGILVWQDFMFANLDYPIEDEVFRALVECEARQLLADLAGRPSLAVLCGNSEVEQQVAMLGLDPALGRGPLFGELLPELARAADADAVYLPSAPCGGDLPFRSDHGVSNYYGVGAYLRPLEDARRAEVRFASECLAFANVPNEATVESVLGASSDVSAQQARWKASVPRDAGADWDFEDVRDHYLRLLYEVDVDELRSVDHDRYLELSRAVTGEVMAEVFGEWRRAASPCGGGLVLWLRDLVPGPGWGVIDSGGEPKVAYHHLRRALAPLAVWTIDEGLRGVVAHVANDLPTPVTVRLRVALYRNLEDRIDEADETVELAAHGAHERNVEALLGRFVDATWAYRFGPPQQDLIVVSLESDGGHRPELLSQAMRFPAERPTTRETAGELGLAASARLIDDGSVRLVVRSRRLTYGARVHVAGFSASDDAFSVEPGGERIIVLRPRQSDRTFAVGTLTALNLEGIVPIDLEEKPQ